MDKKIAVMQPYFFPYIGYFQLINSVQSFVIFDDVNYIKRGWINRNYIMVNKKPFLFTIPLKKISQNKLIKEIEIESSSKWKMDLLNNIIQSYKKAPYFNIVYPIVEIIINYNENNLVLFIINSLKVLCNYLGIKTNFILSSSIYKNNELRGESKIIEICSKLNANFYLNSIGGKELYDVNNFKNNNIRLNFIESESIIYKQFNNDFIPFLSVLDVIMFNSLEETKEILNKYNLI